MSGIAIAKRIRSTIAFLLIGTVAWCQTPQGARPALAGKQAEDLKQYKAALKDQSEKNDANSQYKLGLLYEFPLDGSSANRPGAGYWYKRSSDLGSVRATYRLGLYYYDQGSDTEAYQYLEKAAKAGFPPAMTKLGEMNFKQNLGGNGEYYGLPWLRKAADAGDPDALNDLGLRSWLFYQHPDAPGDWGKSPVEYFTLAAAGGSCEGAVNLGDVYLNGLNTHLPQNAALADTAYQKAESCIGAPAWVLEKAQAARRMIAEGRLPAPSYSIPSQESRTARIDTHEAQAADVIVAIVAVVGIAALFGNHGSSTATPQADDSDMNSWARGMAACRAGLSFTAGTLGVYC